MANRGDDNNVSSSLSSTTPKLTKPASERGSIAPLYNGTASNGTASHDDTIIKRSSTLSAKMLSRHHGKTDAEIDSFAQKFADNMPLNEFTPAEIQGYLLKYKNSPEGAINGVDEWVKATREEKKVRR